MILKIRSRQILKSWLQHGTKKNGSNVSMQLPWHFEAEEESIRTSMEAREDTDLTITN